MKGQNKDKYEIFRSMFWIPNEIDFSYDLELYNKQNHAIKNIINEELERLCELSSILKNIQRNFMQRLISNMYDSRITRWQLVMLDIHIETIDNIISIYGVEPNKNNCRLDNLLEASFISIVIFTRIRKILGRSGFQKAIKFVTNDLIAYAMNDDIPESTIQEICEKFIQKYPDIDDFRLTKDKQYSNYKERNVFRMRHEQFERDKSDKVKCITINDDF